MTALASNPIPVEDFLARLDPAVLHHLAAAAEGAAHRRRWARVNDPETTAGELAELLAAGERPALGWWRKRVVRRDPAEVAVLPSKAVAVVAAELVQAGLTPDQVEVAVVKVAVAGGMDNRTATAAALAGCQAAA